MNLYPLDHPVEGLPDTRVDFWRVRRFSSEQLRKLFIAHGTVVSDVERLSEFPFLVVHEIYESDLNERISTKIRIPGLADAELVYPHGKYYSELDRRADRALFTILLFPWEDIVENDSLGSWEPCFLGPRCTINTDPFTTPPRDLDASNFSYRIVGDPDGEFEIPMEKQVFHESERKLLKCFQEYSKITWNILDKVIGIRSTPKSCFNNLIEHFTLRSYRAQGFDQLLWNIVTIDSAMGNNDGTIKLALRCSKLLRENSIKGEIEIAYKLRSKYIHGALINEQLQLKDLRNARRLARRVAHEVLRLAAKYPAVDRRAMIEMIDRRAVP